MLTRSPRKRRILIVDDSPEQFRLLKELFAHFRGETFDLEWASTFSEGLLSLLSGRHVACLLDYHLGDQNGLELLRHAQVAQCQTPVILLSGEAAEEIDLEAIGVGASDYMLKSEVTARTLERSLRYTLKMSETLKALRELATHDDLTSLLNRRELDRVMGDEWLRASRFGRPFSLALIDLDHFKRINDTYGHQVGDEVLRHVASLLAGQVRSVDRVARYGGEEFAVVQVETDHEGARTAIERLRALLEEMPCILPEKELQIPITLSAGVATYPMHGDSREGIVEAADQALYLAKARGRNRVISADVLPVKGRTPTP